ncbi:MAG: TraR/DksA C4-type zinc finger protein [Mycobacteriales bacterium]
MFVAVGGRADRDDVSRALAREDDTVMTGERAATAIAAERAATLARIDALTADFTAVVSSGLGTAVDDEHDPEGATLAFERAQIAALLADAQAYLAELDGAARRVEQDSYGICEQCAAPIADERLRARPAARRCIRCA